MSKDKLQNPRLEAVLSAMHETVMVTLTPEGIYKSIWLSPDLEERYGLKAGDFPGKTLGTVFSPEAAALLDIIRKVAQTGRPHRTEFHARLPRGEFCFDISISPMPDDKGKTAMLLILGRDITDRKKAERELASYKEHLEELVVKRTEELVQANRELQKQIEQRILTEEMHDLCFQNADDVIALMDAELRILSISPSIRLFLGYKPEELVGKQLGELTLLAEGYTQKAFDEFQKVLGGEKISMVTFGCIAKDGSTKHAEVSAAPLYRDGKIASLVCIARDVSKRQQMQDALKRSEEMYRTLAETAQDMIFMIDRDDRVIYANTYAAAALGARPMDLIGKKRATLFPPHEAQRQTVGLNRVFETGQSSYHEDMTGFPGRSLWLSTWLTPIIGQSGRTEAVLGISRDITKQKEDAEALRQSEQKYRLLIETAQDVIYTLAPDGTITSLNPAFEKVTGWRREDWIGKHFLEITHPDDQAKAMEMHNLFLSGQSLPPVEYRIIGRDGRIRHGEFAVTTIMKDGKPDGELGIARDITDRKAAEQAMRKERDFAQSLVDTAHVIIVVLDSRLRILEFNLFGQTLTGYRQEDVLGKDWVDTFVPAEHKKGILEKLAEMLAGKINSDESPIVTKPGKELLVQWHTAPMYDEKGKISALLAIGLDVTFIRRQEEQLRQAAKMEAIGRLAGGIAHDFNNQLTVIKGYCDLAINDLAADNPLAEPIREIHKASVRAAQLTSQLLAYSRKQLLRPAVININDVISEMSDPLKRLVGGELQLKIIPGDGLGMVRADPSQFQQAIMNLVINARDAMSMGGQLVVSTANVELGPELVRKHPDAAPGPYVMVRIADTGHGMDQKTVEQLFEPFFTTKPMGKGTGLGLAMVYGFVKQSGGHIEVQSRIGRGTIFTIFLPRIAEKSNTGKTAPPSSDQTYSARTVMVVEDERAIRELIIRMLREVGYSVIFASDAKEALKLAADYQGVIDLLIADVVMPGMSGDEMAGRMIAERPGLPVLFISGHGQKVRPDLADKFISSILSKPFNKTDLIQTAKDIMNRSLPGGKT